MRGVVAIIGCGLLLAACTSSQFTLNSPPAAAVSPNTLQLVSTPPGAEAKTTTGQACTTPCSIPVTQPGEVTVTFTLDGYYPLVASARLVPPTDIRDPEQPSASGGLYPNPLVAELELAPPAAPPPAKKRRPAKRKPVTAKRRPPPAAPPPTAASAPPPPAETAAPPVAQPVAPPPAQPVNPPPAVAYPWPTR